MIDKIEARGWKEICEAVGVRSSRTAKKKLIELERKLNGRQLYGEKIQLLVYENTRPVLSLDVYRHASMERHKKR